MAPPLYAIVRPVAVKVTGLNGVPSWLVPPADGTVTVPAVPAPARPPPLSRYRFGEPVGGWLVGGAVVGGAVVGGAVVGGAVVGGAVVGGAVVGGLLGLVPPPALPPLQENAPVVTVRPAGTESVVPVENVTVMGEPLMFDAT
ncbi:hypothetical protein Phou_083360 [Phytohabitans houttuyneae]|uniref:Uncharacterized protein n=1 Tax=Phytohabitans houttuyneae TaxID=1076126 RepID=A0A6V8KQL6_9ACTN|nr:hypothetical protein Phou_083360 [Phytohabitans houttuyneae]